MTFSPYMELQGEKCTWSLKFPDTSEPRNIRPVESIDRLRGKISGTHFFWENISVKCTPYDILLVHMP